MPGTPTPRTITEQLDVTQGKLCIGLRTNCDGADEPAFVALQLLNVIFGSGINSKLFLHVREELGLCYYASSSLERCKGIMLISSGIDFSQFGAARDAILQQLDACKQGQITWDELETARRYLRSAWRASLDAPGRIDDFYLGQAICRLRGNDRGPDCAAGARHTAAGDRRSKPHRTRYGLFLKGGRGMNKTEYPLLGEAVYAHTLPCGLEIRVTPNGALRKPTPS